MGTLEMQPSPRIFTRHSTFPIQMPLATSTLMPVHRTGMWIPHAPPIKQLKLPRTNTIIASAAPNGSQNETSNDGNGNGSGQKSWKEPGVGPKGLADDPVLHDFIMGMGSSGQGAGEKPPGAPGGSINEFAIVPPGSKV